MAIDKNKCNNCACKQIIVYQVSCTGQNRFFTNIKESEYLDIKVLTCDDFLDKRITK